MDSNLSITLFGESFSLFCSGEWFYAIPDDRELRHLKQIMAFNQSAIHILRGHTHGYRQEEIKDLFENIQHALGNDH